MQWCDFDILCNLECPKPAFQHSLFDDWMQHFKPFGLRSAVNTDFKRCYILTVIMNKLMTTLFVEQPLASLGSVFFSCSNVNMIYGRMLCPWLLHQKSNQILNISADFPWKEEKYSEYKKVPKYWHIFFGILGFVSFMNLLAIKEFKIKKKNPVLGYKRHWFSRFVRVVALCQKKTKPRIWVQLETPSRF